MRKIFATVFQSFDGVMQAPGGPSEDPTNGFDLGGWQFGFPDEEAGKAIGDSLKPPYSLLLGRRTYDIFASYWPYHDGEDKAVADDFNAAEKFVMTHSEAPLDWRGSSPVANFEELTEIKRGEGPDLQIWGSSTLYPELIGRGLLDRLTVLTYPLVLGNGKRTFPRGTPPTTLRFEGGKTTAKGTAIATFVPELGVAVGQSPPARRNEREVKRQSEIEDGRW